MSKSESQHNLYEIRTASQPPLVTEVLSVEQIVELARLRDFLYYQQARAAPSAKHA